MDIGASGGRTVGDCPAARPLDGERQAARLVASNRTGMRRHIAAINKRTPKTAGAQRDTPPPFALIAGLRARVLVGAEQPSPGQPACGPVEQVRAEPATA